jgi:hypothetical protein
MGKTLAALLAACLLFLAGCAGLSDSLFLLRRLDDPAKSRAVTEQGIEFYKLSLVSRGEYERVGEVRRYFEVALRYDPGNQKAQAYLDLVDSFRTVETRKRVREAGELLKKSERSREQDYALCVAVACANQLAPGDEEVVSLLNQTAKTRGTLTSFYLQSGREARSQALAVSSSDLREQQYLDAFRSFNRVLAVDPQNRGAQAEKNSILASVQDIAAAHLDGARRLVGKSKFAEAQKEAVLVEELNLRLDHRFDRELEEFEYSLQYKWARSLLERKDYAKALARVDSALAVRKSEEASALKQRILAARRQSVEGMSFEAALAEVDRLIAQEDLPTASQRLEALRRGTRERARLNALEARREKLRGLLPALYEKAVAFYRAEDFQSAAELLAVVLAVDVEYEQAAEYLDKARTKQKLLERYGTGE